MEIAGKNRANVFTSIMQNAKQLEKAYDKLKDAAGSAEKEQSAYMDSLSGRINALKESLTGLSIQMINTDFLKGTIDTMTTGVNAVGSFIDKVGAMPAAITGVTGVMAIFNKSFRESTNSMLLAIPGYGKLTTSIDGFGKRLKDNVGDIKDQIEALKKQQESALASGKSTTTLGLKMTALNGKLALTTAGLIATKVAAIALNAALSMGASLIISSIVNALSKWVDGLITTKSELRELNQEFLSSSKATNEEIASINNLVEKYKSLEEQLKSGNLTSQEQKNKKEELISVQRELANLLPESATAFSDEEDKIATNTEKILENLDAKKKLLESDAIKIIDENSNYETRIKAPQEYEKFKKQLEEMREAYKKNEEYMGSQVDSKWLEKIEKKVEEYEEAIKVMSSAIEALRNAGWDENRIAQEIFKNMPLESSVQWYEKLVDVTDRYTQSLEIVADKTSDLGGKSEAEIESLIKQYENLGYSVDEAKQKVEELLGIELSGVDSQSIEEATKKYGEAVDKAKELDSMLQKINEAQALTPDIVSELAKNYTELGAGITDFSTVQDYLTSKIQEQVAIQQEAYQIMIGDDEEYYAARIKNSEAAQIAFDEFASKFVDVNGENYDIDLENFTTLNQAKGELIDQLSIPLGEFLANLIGGSAEGYAEELRNTRSYATAKALILQKLSEQVTKVETQMIKLLESSQAMKYVHPDAAWEDYMAYEQAKKQAEILKAEQEKIEASFEEFYASFNTSTPTFGKGSSTIGSSSNSNKGSNSSSKEISDLEDLTNRYHDLEDAIKDCTNALSANKALQDGTTSKNKKVELMREEIELYKKQAQAVRNLNEEQKREANELKNYLSQKGVTFDSSGDISNYNQILKSKTNWANSFSGEAKESAKNSVKEFESILKRYDELVNSSIPKQEQEWYSLQNSINSVQEAINEMYKAQLKLEDFVDRYHDLESAVNNYSNALSLVKLLQNNANDKGKINLMKQEIELYQKQADAVKKLNEEQKKELEELRNELYGNGFRFDSDFNILDVNGEFTRKVLKANSMTDLDQREIYLAFVEDQKEVVKRYNELIKEKIPDLDAQVIELGNTAVDVQEKILDIMDESLQKMISKLDKEISKLEFNIDITGGTNATNTTIFKAQIIQLQKDKIKELNKALEELTKTVPTTEAQQESLSERIEETKDQITEAEQELRKLAGAYEEYGIELLYSPYRDKMWQIGTQQMNKVDLEMQTTEDTDTSKRIQLMKEKLELQKTMVEETRKYLQKLRNTTTTTTEGYQALIEKIKEAEEELHSQETAFNNLNKELEEFYKDKLNTVADVETEISNLIKKEAEKRIEQEKKVLEEALEADKKRLESKKKTLDEERKLYNKQYDQDDYEAKLNEERNKLLDIQAEIDKLQWANDRASQEKLQSLMKEYSEQQKVINDMIKENQHEAINDRFEQEQEMIDKELEDKQEAYEQAVEELNQKLENFLTPDNLTNLVAAAINTGLVEVMGDTVELNDAMKKMLKESEVGVANLNIQFDSWLNKLAEIKDVTMDINKLMSNAGLNVSTDLSKIGGSLASSRSVSIDMGGINIEGNVDKNVLSDLDKMFKKQQNEILNIVAKKLGGK